MIHIFGEVFLTIALFCASLQSLLPLIGYARHNIYLLASARTLILAQCMFVIGAYVLLTIAFYQNDFSIAYVAANSHPSLPFMYRLTAVWGAHEGSILLWILILNLWSVLFSMWYRKALLPLVAAILGMISVCFLCFLLFTSNPFLLAAATIAGKDLNPLLQDPGFVTHPPMLYAGYVGFSVAFAITIAALIRGQMDQDWLSLSRRFALAAWSFLTLGITLGSWWAYRVLGWGGFWFWDPVENASLLPWLSGTALLHVLLLAEKRNTAKPWAALLAIVCFILSILGTFLVRSGVLVSAHTFANDPARGVFLLLLLAIISTAALIIYAFRMAKWQSHNTSFTWLSREAALLLNSILLFVAMLTILLGTLYPLILDALHLGSISVGAPYFNKVMLPFVLITMVVMGFAPFCQWQQHSLLLLWRQTYKKIAISLLAALLVLWLLNNTLEPIAVMSLALSFWIMLSIKQSLRLVSGMAIAHFGFAVLIIGIMMSSLLNIEREVKIKPGDQVSLGPYQFLFLDAQFFKGPNYLGMRGAFDVIKRGRHIINLYPEKRLYPVRQMVMSKVDIHPGLFRDLYIALGESLEQNFWSVRLYYKPFVRWIWMGGIIMMIGGFIAMLQRQHFSNNIPNYIPSPARGRRAMDEGSHP